MKRVLIITYYWPPAGGSGVQRWVKFAKYLPSEGWQPVIYTPVNPEISSVDETLLKDIPAEAEVIKTHISEPYAAYRRLMGSGSSTDMKTLIATSGSKGAEAGATGGEVNPISSGRKSFKQNLSLWIRGNIFIPDPRVWWVGPSVRHLKKYLKEHPVDVIVSTGPPHSMHLIGRRLSLATGIPWIPDFRDPWTKMFYFKHLRLNKLSLRRHLRMEQQVLDDAAAVISVTPMVQADFQERTTTRVHLITNGFDEADFASIMPAAVPEGEFRIVHTGLFAADGNPLTLWDVLASKCADDPGFDRALRICLVGKVDAEIMEQLRLRGLGGHVEAAGYLSHDEAVARQKGCSLLILPLRMDPEYRKVLPGKIFEYLASGRPVLGIGQEDGAAAQVLEQTGAGRMFDWDNADGMRAFVDEAYRRFAAGVAAPAAVGIDGYSRRNLTRRLAELLDSVIAENN